MHEPEPWLLWRYFEAPTGAAAAPPAHAVTANFGDEIRLLGYNLSPETIHPGETFTLTFYWQAVKSLEADYNVFVHLYAPGDTNTPLAQSDGPPCQGTYTTSRMEADEIVIDERTLTLPSGFEAASATLGVGLYGWPSLERLPLTQAETRLPDERLQLAEIKITH